jgi:hypothetical protein
MKNKKKQKRTFYLFGFYIAGITALVTILTFIIAFLTPPLSGPYCPGPCFDYPYTDILSRFPRDYYWMYPAILISLLYIVLMVFIHCYARKRKKIFSQAGLSLAIIAAAILITNYFLQVTVIQAGLLYGETEGIAMLTQYNPHGVFIALEEVSYILMSISFFCVIPVFSGTDGLKKAIRWTYLTGFVLAVLSLIFVSLRYGLRREYLFEIIIISIVWFELVISSILLSLVFRRALTD